MTIQQDQLTWEKVLERDDLIGGDIESVEDGVAYRGPLSKIWIDGSSVRFESPWTARLDGGTWKAWHKNTFSVNKEYTFPQDIGQGRIFFNMIMLGHGTIFPKGGSKLDPAKVEGLHLT